MYITVESQDTCMLYLIHTTTLLLMKISIIFIPLKTGEFVSYRLLLFLKISLIYANVLNSRLIRMVFVNDHNRGATATRGEDKKTV